MKISYKLLRRFHSLSLAVCLSLAAVGVSCGADSPNPAQAADASKDKPAAAAGDLVPLDLKLPAPAFKGTPKDIQLSSYVEPLSDKPRPAMMVPAGLKNLAPSAKISSSSTNTPQESLAKIVDADKESSDQSIIFLRKGTQYLQMDLGSSQELFALVIWHAHNTAKVYHDVIILASDDSEFKTGVQTLFNNDQDNSSNLGAGTDREYFE